MTVLKASKTWTCAGCGRLIQPGDVFVMDDGMLMCEDCATDPKNAPDIIMQAMTAH